jgi:hypothetical protein
MGKLIRAIMLVVVVGMAGYVAFDQVNKWHERGMERGLAGWQRKAEKLEGEVINLRKELVKQRVALIPSKRLLEVFGEESVELSPEQGEIDCEELERHIISFFTYLNEKGYGKSYGIQERTYDFFKRMVEQLSEKPPMVTGEMKDLSSLIRNMAHFYRILGKKEVELIKEIVRSESEIVESLVLIFFAWSNSGDRCESIIKGYPSLNVMYEYAGFFLNALAGKSYLLRRDSKVRILTTYYSILILDRANDETLNRHGIDIRPYIDFLFYEILNQRGLVYQRQYLAELVGLKEKYKR